MYQRLRRTSRIMPLSLTFFRKRLSRLSGDSSGRNCTLAIPFHLPSSISTHSPTAAFKTAQKNSVAWFPMAEDTHTEHQRIDPPWGGRLSESYLERFFRLGFSDRRSTPDNRFGDLLTQENRVSRLGTLIVHICRKLVKCDAAYAPVGGTRSGTRRSSAAGSPTVRGCRSADFQGRHAHRERGPTGADLAHQATA